MCGDLARVYYIAVLYTIAKFSGAMTPTRFESIVVGEDVQMWWNSTPMIMAVLLPGTKMKRIFEVRADQGLEPGGFWSRLYGDSMGVLGKMSRDS